MRFEKIKTYDTYTLKFISDIELESGNLGLLDDINKLKIYGQIAKIAYLDNTSDLEFKFNNSRCVMVKIISKNKDCYVGDFICFSSPKEIMRETLCIDIDEKIKKIEPKHFILMINKQKHIVIMSGNDTQDKIANEQKSKLKKEIEKLEKQKKSKEKIEEKIDEELEKLEKYKKELSEFDRQEADKMAFGILSDDKFMAVKQIDSDRFRATKLTSIKDFEFSNLRLLELRDDLRFENKPISEVIAKSLTKSQEINSRYLEIWDKYADLEGEMLLNRARKVGFAKINKEDCKITDRNFIVRIDKDLREVLGVGDMIVFSDDIPQYLEDKNISWKEYLQKSDNNDNNNKKEQKTAELTGVTSESIKIAFDENLEFELLKKFKYIMLSIYGSEVDLKRKEKARAQIKSGKIANPNLALALQDENLEQLKDRNKNNIEAFPYSSNVKDSVFKNPPTQNQEEAIRIALNTPDFAIIQGPPGTGKTTVLTAIIERLNEISDKGKNIKGSILVSAFQHDAVENIISRMRVNGLPPIKFGKKSKSIDDLSSFENIMQWGRDIAQNIQIAPDSQIYLKFDGLVKIYENRPCKSTKKALLENIIQMRPIDYKLKEIVQDELRELAIEEDTSDNLKNLKEIYAIRTNLISFADDGTERNRDALKLIDKNDKKSADLLLQTENINEEYIKKLRNLKEKLIKRYKSKAHFDIEKVDDDLMNLVENIKKALQNQTVESRVNQVKARFKEALLQDPFALQDMIKDYSVVYSATTGQSMGKDILREKVKGSDDRDGYTYENVIIDEAARANPMDLFLVLMLSKNRMILVGDHRQLPHMVEDEIVEKLEVNDEVDVQEKLKESMFEYLIDRAKKLEGIDGVKRFVTLNNQYRTHPLLGRFVSDNFYKEFGEEFGSPLNASYFEHDLEGIENIPAVWIDAKEGKTQRSNSGSSTRESEAKIIAKYLKKWSGQNQELSFGVISFYSAQVELLRKELKDEIANMENRLRIGSVDSFQGMEFDFVFLSVVRSEKSFGFLRSVNRLCVSMSRQKKCLIVVGNKDFFTTQKAKEEVSGLYNFAKLCESDGVVL